MELPETAPRSGARPHPHNDFRPPPRQPDRPTDSIEQIENILMELFASHGSRDLAGSQLGADDFGERAAGTQYALRVKNLWPVLFIFDEALDSTIIRVETNEAAQRRRHE